ncbi:MAG: hypothetical protein H2173_00560 [Opitutus sp.]|nr:hypothetical protein [Opitutus sp.]MCS6275942.1 hypothetical protein [Opitutus sp.]
MKTYKQNACGTFDKYINGILVGHCISTDSEFVAWCEAGNTPEPYVPPALTVADYIAATQMHLDAHAQAWGYDDLKSACTYDGDPYPRFAAEALALRNWRSQVWAYLDSTSAAPLPEVLPTVAQFIALLPTAPTRPLVE